jgi:hypothetical protein
MRDAPLLGSDARPPFALEAFSHQCAQASWDRPCEQ